MGIAQTVLMIQDNLTECFNKLDCDGVIYRERYNAFCFISLFYDHGA